MPSDDAMFGIQADLPHYNKGATGISFDVPLSYVTGNGIAPPADNRLSLNSTAPAEWGETQLLYSDYEFYGQNRNSAGIGKPIYSLNNWVPNADPTLEEQSQIYWVDGQSGGI